MPYELIHATTEYYYCSTTDTPPRPATITVLRINIIMSRLLFNGNDPGQLLPFEQLQASPASGRDMRHLVTEASILHSRNLREGPCQHARVNSSTDLTGLSWAKEGQTVRIAVAHCVSCSRLCGFWYSFINAILGIFPLNWI